MQKVESKGKTVLVTGAVDGCTFRDFHSASFTHQPSKLHQLWKLLECESNTEGTLFKEV